MENNLKKCTECGNDFPATTEYFHKHKNGKNGLNPKCKSCIIIYRKINKDKIKIYFKEHYQRNKKEINSKKVSYPTSPYFV